MDTFVADTSATTAGTMTLTRVVLVLVPEKVNAIYIRTVCILCGPWVVALRALRGRYQGI
jgi:hypothetical protein